MTHSRVHIACLLLSVVAILLAGCATAAERSPSTWPTEGWLTSTPEAQGIDSDQLADMLQTIQQNRYAIDSVLVVRNGMLVLESYVYPASASSRHAIHSCTKSIVSALVGIAVERGYIQGVDQPVLDLFPQRATAHLDARKEAMTLGHLLTMSTGLQCQDSYLYRWRGLNELRASVDWVQFALNLPMAEDPGTRFEYCNSASFLLSAIIHEATGMSSLEFAREHLFGPLGIDDVEWTANPQGISIGWGQLQMLPRDMAKIGYLYLNQGRWGEQQVVPAAWVAASTRQHITARTLQEGYGYQWWIHPADMYMALGYGGQYIVVAPKVNLVVVFTSELPEREFFVPQELLTAFILPAVRSSAALPENPNAVARLQSLIEDLATDQQ